MTPTSEQIFEKQQARAKRQEALMGLLRNRFTLADFHALRLIVRAILEGDCGSLREDGMFGVGHDPSFAAAGALVAFAIAALASRIC